MTTEKAKTMSNTPSCIFAQRHLTHARTLSLFPLSRSTLSLSFLQILLFLRRVSDTLIYSGSADSLRDPGVFLKPVLLPSPFSPFFFFLFDFFF